MGVTFLCKVIGHNYRWTDYPSALGTTRFSTVRVFELQPVRRRARRSSQAWWRMKRIIAFLALFLSACQPVTSSSSTTMLPPVLAHPAIQKVTKEVDGDSLCVAPADTPPVTTKNGAPKCTGVEVRLIGVNTPETVSPAQKQGKPKECYGPEASAHTAAQVPVGTSVLIVYDSRNGTKPDKYGRPLVYLYRQSDGLFLNLDLAKEGFARNDPYSNTTDHAAEFKSAAAEAQQDKRGLWGKC